MAKLSKKARGKLVRSLRKLLHISYNAYVKCSYSARRFAEIFDRKFLNTTIAVGKLAAFVVLFLIFSVTAWVAPKIFMANSREYHEKKAQLDSIYEDIRASQEENDDLRRQLDVMKTPEGVEETAREKLGMIRPGEVAYVVDGTIPKEIRKDPTKVAASEENPDSYRHRLLYRLCSWML
ncbi:MAG: septum formation initiator family protein [bacterium]|nr:septum formation initiator family protein [bacterium]